MNLHVSLGTVSLLVRAKTSSLDHLFMILKYIGVITRFVDDRMSSLLPPEKPRRGRRDEAENASLLAGDLIYAAQRLLEDDIVQRARKILKEQTERTHQGRDANGVSSRVNRRTAEPSKITDHALYSFLLKNNGRPTRRDEIFDSFCTDEEGKRVVAEKLSTMERFDLIAVKGDFISLKKVDTLLRS